MTRAGFIGLGSQGAGMAQRIIGQGVPTTLWARREISLEPFAGTAAFAADPVELGRASDVVGICVTDGAAVRDVTLGPRGVLAGMKEGSILALHSTIGADECAEIAEAALARGVDVIDAPVSGSPHDIAAGHVTLFVGGSDDAIERARPVLSGYADPILNVGPIGAGQGVKLVNNTLFAAQIGLLHEAVRLGERLGVDERQLLDAIGHGSAASRVVSMVGARGSVSAFIDIVGEFVGKDVAVVRKTAAELGSDLGLLDEAINAGFKG
jgi:3-hydroxyisobutyrate dehydrogenase-like beta-hydroxyacid dehydrogenase